MSSQKGFSIIVVIFVVLAVAVITTISGYFFLDFGGEEKVQTAQVEQIQEALEDHLGGEEVDVELRLLNISSDFARGEISGSDTESPQTAIFARIGDKWKVIKVTKESLFCEEMGKFGVPAGMISDCILQYPDAKDVAKTLADVKKVLKVEEEAEDDVSTISEIRTEAEIIGIISFPNEPACPSCAVISSGGETIDVVLNPNQISSGDLDGIQSGDTVVIEVEIIASEDISSMEPASTDTSADSDDEEDEDASADVEEEDEEDAGTDEEDGEEDEGEGADEDGEEDASADVEEDEGDDTNIQVVVNEIEEVGNNDEGEDSATNDGDEGLTEDPVDDPYDITNLPPGTAPPDSEYFNGFFDLDTSSSLIKIIGDF